MARKEFTIRGKKDENGLHISHDMSGKMELVNAMSTSPLENELCMKRTKCDGMVCKECYSMNANKYKKSLRENLIENYHILTERILENDEILFLTSESGLFRFEAFGDIADEKQVVNYFNHAKENAHLQCALWTKNPWIIERAIKHYNLKKPENLKIIGSSYYINKPMVKFYKRYYFIDNVFTVYSLDYVKEHNTKINCGGFKCWRCRKCYDGTHDNYEINELLKADSKKAKDARIETFTD